MRVPCACFAALALFAQLVSAVSPGDDDILALFQTARGFIDTDADDETPETPAPTGWLEVTPAPTPEQADLKWNLSIPNYTTNASGGGLSKFGPPDEYPGFFLDEMAQHSLRGVKTALNWGTMFLNQKIQSKAALHNLGFDPVLMRNQIAGNNAKEITKSMMCEIGVTGCEGCKAKACCSSGETVGKPHCCCSSTCSPEDGCDGEPLQMPDSSEWAEHPTNVGAQILVCSPGHKLAWRGQMKGQCLQDWAVDEKPEKDSGTAGTTWEEEDPRWLYNAAREKKNKTTETEPIVVPPENFEEDDKDTLTHQFINMVNEAERDETSEEETTVKTHVEQGMNESDARTEARKMLKDKLNDKVEKDIATRAGSSDGSDPNGLNIWNTSLMKGLRGRATSFYRAGESLWNELYGSEKEHTPSDKAPHFDWKHRREPGRKTVIQDNEDVMNEFDVDPEQRKLESRLIHERYHQRPVQEGVDRLEELQDGTGPRRQPN